MKRTSASWVNRTIVGIGLATIAVTN